MDPSRRFPAALRAAAFEIEVDGDNATIVSAPFAGDGSYLATDDVVLLFEGVTRTPVDAYGHRQLTVTLQLRNGSAHALVAGPAADAAAIDDQLLIIPLEVWVPETKGEVSSDGGTDVTVAMPNQGEAQLADDWTGRPTPFFSASAFCTRPTLSCRPYESMPAPLLPSGTSESRALVFNLDATVHVLRFRVLLAGRPAP